MHSASYTWGNMPSKTYFRSCKSRDRNQHDYVNAHYHLNIFHYTHTHTHTFVTSREKKYHQSTKTMLQAYASVNEDNVTSK